MGAKQKELRPIAAVSLLLVDDEKKFLEVYSGLLRKLGCRVSTANTGAAALILLEKQSYDLALVDAIMPGMDGLDLLDQIRVRWPGLPVVMFTGKAKEDVEQEALDRGAVDYLYKPVVIAELKDTIETQLGVELRPLPTKAKTLMPEREEAARPQWRTKLPAARERDMIISALNQCRWNKKDAAKLLGIGYSTLWRRMAKLDIR